MLSSVWMRYPNQAYPGSFTSLALLSIFILLSSAMQFGVHGSAAAVEPSK